MKTKIFLVILFLIISFFIFLRLPQILADNFVFVFDMGRDMLWTRDIIVLGKPYLIGPWGSLEGIFFGPAWYYLLAVPFLITKGDPRGSVLLVLFFHLIILIGIYFIGRKIKDELFGIILSLLVASSTILLSLSTFAFHANLLPLITLFFIWSLYQVTRGKINYLLLAALMTSLSFHFEPAAAIFTTLTLIVFIFWRYRQLFKKFKLILASFGVFCLPFTPQIVFELRHNFLQTKAMFAYFLGKNKTLGGVLPFKAKFEDRINKFIELFFSTFFSFRSFWLMVLLIALMVIFLILYKSSSKKEKSFLEINLLVLIIPFLGYLFLFPPELKLWYLYGLVIPFIILVAWVVRFIWQKLFLLGLIILCFLTLTGSNFPVRVNNLLQKKIEFHSFETLAEQKKIIDWIYNDASGLPFQVFVSTAPIYDYHYQYLFWWYGKSKYYYWPEEYSYLPGKVDYVPYKDKYINLQKNIQPAKDPVFVYLIIEPNPVREHIRNWLSIFESQELLKEEKFSSGVIIQKRKITRKE